MHRLPHRTIGLLTVLSLAFVLMIAGPGATAAPAIGGAAPPFAGSDTQGRVHTLTDYQGKIVVLEWTNHDCPFVVNHYRSGNMQALQREAAAKGVVWLTVISSAPGEQGHVTAAEADRLTRERNAAPTAVILDAQGTIGKAYGAKTTPHMFIIAADGTLAYMGAIDDRATTSGDPKTARNYVREALAALDAGKAVPTAVTQAYGCSVKYGS
jgi:peroxiredoxin